MSGSASPVVTTVTADINDLRRAAGEASQLFAKIFTDAERVSTGMRNQAAAADQAAGGMRNLGNVIGQAGFQVQDFAVQVQGGTSVLTALSQQGSQLLGVFGTGGAIAGAVLTLTLLGTQLLSNTTKAETFTEAIDRLGKEYDDAKAAAERWMNGFAKEADGVYALQRQYEAATEAVRKFEDARLRNAENELQRRQRETALDIVSPGRGFSEAAQGIQPGYDALGNPLGFTVQGPIPNLAPRTRALTDALRAFEEAGTPGLEGIARLYNRMEALATGNDAIAEAAREVMKKVTAAQGDVRRAEELATQLANQRQALEGTLLPLPPADPGAPPGGGGGRGTDQELTFVWREISKAMEGFAEATGKSSLEFDRLMAQLDPAEAAMQRYQQRITTLRTALDDNNISLSDFNRGLQLSARALDQDLNRAAGSTDTLKTFGREMGTVFTSAFDGMITGSRNFNDALKRLEQGIARVIERTFITKPFETAFSSLLEGFASRNFGGFFSSLFGGGGESLGSLQAAADLNILNGAPGLAVGGEVGPFEPYIVGERGPELFVPKDSGRIIPNHELGGGGATVINNIDARGADQGVEARIDAVLARRLPLIYASVRERLLRETGNGGNTAKALGRRQTA